MQTYAYDTDELRTQSVIEEPEGPIEEPSISLLPERTLKRKKNQPRGSFRRLQERGLHITNYQERGFKKEKDSE